MTVRFGQGSLPESVGVADPASVSGHSGHEPSAGRSSAVGVVAVDLNRDDRTEIAWIDAALAGSPLRVGLDHAGLVRRHLDPSRLTGNRGPNPTE